MKNWQPNLWQKKTIYQNIPYPDFDLLHHYVKKITKSTHIVSIDEIEKLKHLIYLANEGKVFLLHAGECVEQFNNATHSAFKMSKLLISLKNILQNKLNKPVIIIGRIAGQFSKPRTKLYEHFENKILSYRGDLINTKTLTIKDRTPNPINLFKGYNESKKIFMNLKNTHYVPSNQKDPNGNSFIYTSHEALNLYYEQALTHKTSNDSWYNLSTHLPWLGIRTNQIDGAHIEYLKGIKNPIGIKIGPNTDILKLKEIIHILNPKNTKNRILLISRFGLNNVSIKLPNVIEIIQKYKLNVTWCCDPMHGNTHRDKNKHKIRYCNELLKEYFDKWFFFAKDLVANFS